jgi:hypothetical protein
MMKIEHARTTNSYSISCHFCGGSHSCRNCPLEKKISPHMKGIIGSKIEHFIVDKLYCPSCYQRNTLIVLGDNSPSLDIVCTNCNLQIEAKSKCMSCKNIPDDIYLKHGNYNEYLNRQKNKLDFIIVIYKIDRKKKHVIIRKVYHIPHHDIIKNNNFKVIKNNNKNDCSININKISKYNNFILNKIHIFDFTKCINQLIETLF